MKIDKLRRLSDLAKWRPASVLGVAVETMASREHSERWLDAVENHADELVAVAEAAKAYFDLRDTTPVVVDDHRRRAAIVAIQKLENV